MRLINKIKHIKRHRRNKQLSKTIDALYYRMFHIPVMLVAFGHVFVNPLTYEILHFRYDGEVWLNMVHPDKLVEGYTDVISVKY